MTFRHGIFLCFAAFIGISEVAVAQTCLIGPILNNDTTLCAGSSLILTSRSALTYAWSPASVISDTTIQNPVLTADSTRTIYLNTTEYSNNLIANSDFELGNTGFFTTYVYCNSFNCLWPLSDNGYSVGPNANFFHVGFTGTDHTTGSGNFMIINGAHPSLIVWRETITVTPNTNYAFGAWVCSLVNNSPAQLRFSINGVQLGPIYFTPSAVNQWTQFYITWNSGANTSAVIELVDVLPLASGNDFGLDDFFFGEIVSCSDSLQVSVFDCNFIDFPSCFDTITTTAGKPIRLAGVVPKGGNFTGPGITGDLFYPGIAGTGTHTLTYHYTYVLGGVTKTATRRMHVLPAPVFTCGNVFTDPRDNRQYGTVAIGSQCWMTDNLDYGTRVASAQHLRDNCIHEKYCWQDNDASCTAFGAIYQWDEVMRYEDAGVVQDFCPPGWHIPTEADWNTLFGNYTSIAYAGRQLKPTGSSGFNAILSGVKFHSISWKFGSGDPWLNSSIFWTATPYGPRKALAHGLNEVVADPFFTHSANTYPGHRNSAFAIRCIRD